MDRKISNQELDRLVNLLGMNLEEYKDLNAFFQRLEEILEQKITERSNIATEEAREYDDAVATLKKFGIETTDFGIAVSGKHQFVFGKKEKQVGPYDYEVVDEGVIVDESIFEDPENSNFIQELKEKRSRIARLTEEASALDEEIKRKEEQLKHTLFGKGKKEEELRALRARRRQIHIPVIRESEENFERLLLEMTPEERETIASSIKKIQELRNRRIKKKFLCIFA